MNVRQSKLLNSIVREYIETATPVGSSFLVSKYGLDISPATVRNEMAILEKEGYIYHPHTSAGRMPTEEGYKFFVQTILHEGDNAKALDIEIESALNDAAHEAANYTELLKNVAKTIAELTGETMLVAMSRHEHYYTGISNLFRKPELKDQAVIVDIAQIVDEFDESMEEMFHMVGAEPKILIGHENPFGESCASIVTTVRMRNHESIFGLLGLMRMHYEENLSIMKHVQKLMNI